MARALILLGCACVAALVALNAAFFYERLLDDEELRARRREIAAVASALKVSLTALDAVEQKLVRQACTRDLNVDRLSLELNVEGAEAVSARRTAESLARLFGADAALLMVEGATVRALSSNLSPTPVFERAILEESAKRGVAVSVRGKPSVIASCKKDFARGSLWVVAIRDLATWASSLRSDTEVRVERAMDANGEEPLVVSEVKDVGGQEAFRLVLPPKPSHRDTDWLLMTNLALSGVLLGLALGFVMVMRERKHEAALLELERAFDRVASGDLVSSIGLRTGDRADQTFGTFDRMTKELREMRERLAQAEREAAFRDVAQRIAHEIKNPLFPIRTAMETLRKAHGQNLQDFSEILDESTRAVLDEVTRMERIVREFAEFARLPKANPGAIDLASLISDTLPIYTPEDLIVEVELDQSVGEVRADREQITQALVNLLKNAFDAARERANPKVRVSLAKERGCAFIHVDDSGPGISESARERVLEPYFTTKGHGTGLGLAIVKRIMSDHHGELIISKSALGGARVTLKLPMDAAQVSQSPSRP